MIDRLLRALGDLFLGYLRDHRMERNLQQLGYTRAQLDQATAREELQQRQDEAADRITDRHDATDWMRRGSGYDE